MSEHSRLKGWKKYLSRQIEISTLKTEPTPGYLADFVTRSNESVRLRLLQKEDAPLLVDLFYHLSAESKRLRFQCSVEKIPNEQVWQEALRLSHLDPQQHLAIVATIIEDDNQEHAIGVTRLARDSEQKTEAEVAIVIRDDFQRKGLGKHMLLELAEQARSRGITHFTGWVLAENLKLVKLIENLEVSVEADMRHGQRKFRVPI